MKKIILSKVILLTALLFFFGLSTMASLYPFTATYSGNQENPATASAGTGTITGVYNDVNNTIYFSVNFSGLSGNTVGAHFHAAALPTANAGVIYGYTGFPTGVTSGTFTSSFIITEPQEVQLKAGLWYSNIHTTAFLGGEIRSQINLGAASANLYTFNNTYSGAQENPAVTTDGTGTIAGVYNPATKIILFRVNFSGLSGSTAAGHFHAPALPGSNAGVIYGYTGFPTGVTSGVYSGTNTISALQETQLLGGLWYSNIHTSAFLGGEIRAQITLQLAATITCPSNIVASNNAGLCSASVMFAAMSTGVPAPAIVYSVNNAPITSPYIFPVGTTTVTAVATNSTGTASCTFTVRVNDTEAPVITNMSASPNELWPPNNKMRDVEIAYTSTDNCPGMATCVLSVSSNEAGGSDDYTILDAHHVKLRAQREGSGSGRVYTITTRCTDVAGNFKTATTTVTVPHDMSGKHSNSLVGDSKNDEDALSLKISSNPTSTYFGVDIKSADNVGLISVKLVDVAGNIVEVKNNIKAGQFIRIGQQAKPGIYMLQVSQGKQSKQITLVKQ